MRKQYLLIDGNNLACRVSWANETLTNSDGVPTGVHYGFMNSLISLKNRFPNAQMLIAWDGKSDFRMKLSKEANEKGLIPALYKSNRVKDELPKPLKDFYSQANYLKKGIGTLGIPQIRYEDQEADDILASYAKQLSENNEVILVTSDKDYYQMLKPNVTIYDGMKQISISEYDFKNMTGLDPCQWVDVGSLMGDDGDAIFGVPGWGEKTAIKEILNHKTVQNLITNYDEKYKNYRETYADLCKISDQNTYVWFDELVKAKSEKGKTLYPEISYNMPYTGVLYAYHKGLIKMPKVDIMLLVFQDRVRVAYKLKKSIDNISDLPEIQEQDKNESKLLEYFETYEIVSLAENIKLFF